MRTFWALALLAFSFRFRTFSWRADIPSVGVKVPSVEPVMGLSEDLESTGNDSLGRVEWDLGSPFSFGLLFGEIGSAKSSTSMRSSEISQDQRRIAYHQRLHFRVQVAY